MTQAHVSLSRRLTVVLILLAALMLGLIGRLFYLQGMQYEYYLGKVLDNIQQERVIEAERGSMYDRNGNLLATNSTTWRVFISPFDIDRQAESVQGASTEQARKIAKGLSEILGVDEDEIFEKTQKKNRKDETVKKNVEKADADLVLEFIKQNDLKRQVYLEATSKRYYPYGLLACQVIGVMGTDKGLSGLELYYNEEMEGTDGVYRTAANAMSESMPTKYETYIDAQNGYNIITTIDVNIQSILEEQLKQTYEENQAENRVCGIVMDVTDGSILAMATYPTFDLNAPYTLVGEYLDEMEASGLEYGSEEYTKKFWELVYQMWNNKAISDTYNPGSTFKIMTTAAAMNEGLITSESIFSCNGSWVSESGTRIACAAKNGHGDHKSFAYMLQQSCNPTLIRTAMAMGRETFWKYFVDFGFTGLTGIDLPGESRGINYSYPNGFSVIDLAVSAFGQGFKTTPLQEITAISAVANGGTLVTPHLVSAITDSDGNIIRSFDNNAKRQIVSESVCKTITEILAEGVKKDGGARNANVIGYEVAAKTGTSEKKDTLNEATGEYDLRVGSCVGYAPAADPQVSVLIVVDEPNTDGKKSRAGGYVAAPYIAGCMSEILPYLGVQKNYSEEEKKMLSAAVPDCEGKKAEEVTALLQAAGIKCKTVGEGSVVVGQMPGAGDIISKANSTVLLYLGEEGDLPEFELAQVPNVEGQTVSAAIRQLINAGFNVNITGTLNYEAGSGAIVRAQSVKLESKPKGSAITIECVHTDVDDAA